MTPDDAALIAVLWLFVFPGVLMLLGLRLRHKNGGPGKGPS